MEIRRSGFINPCCQKPLRKQPCVPSYILCGLIRVVCLNHFMKKLIFLILVGVAVICYMLWDGAGTHGSGIGIPDSAKMPAHLMDCTEAQAAFLGNCCGKIWFGDKLAEQYKVFPRDQIEIDKVLAATLARQLGISADLSTFNSEPDQF